MSTALKNLIGLSFVFLGIYSIAILFGWTVAALMLVGISPVVVIYIAYKVLTDPNPSKRTFDQYFYEDYEYTRCS